MLAELIASHLPASVSQWTAPIQSWQEGVTPMSTLKSVITASTLYVVVVIGGQALMRPFSPVPARLVKWPFFFHNLLLSLASLLLLVLYLEKEFGFIGKHGVHDALCYGPHFHDVEMYHIINYYFKYWEFMDTVFLVIKKKKLMFLHVYHHMATAALCYSQIVNETTLSWVIIALNLAVHVIMYGYYAMASVGIRCPWKKWITTGQIVQFVIDVAVCVYGIYNHYTSKYASWIPHVRYCHGRPPAAFSGLAILASYLFLFIIFYKDTYKTAPSKKKAQ
ncbi:very-long-chain 3-oxoacyl-CoA synthase [Malassezia caprae]|uniref:Elongation of fatty acids protein n=1 Tax=Malassezia caprae TaxID=1381934 RepID=A0AAF0ED02_9BASI|nr:very-long-chain 3-oxoacyl-CoA synthase [Malassezia caprae]